MMTIYKVQTKQTIFPFVQSFAKMASILPMKWKERYNCLAYWSLFVHEVSSVAFTDSLTILLVRLLFLLHLSHNVLAIDVSLKPTH